MFNNLKNLDSICQSFAKLNVDIQFIFRVSVKARYKQSAAPFMNSYYCLFSLDASFPVWVSP